MTDLPKSAHPHNDVDPRPTPDPDQLMLIIRTINTMTNSEIEEIKNHASYVLAMRDYDDNR